MQQPRAQNQTSNARVDSAREEDAMTAQAKELLLLDGRAEWLQCLPLQGHLEERKIDLRNFGTRWSTGLYRGYQGIWEIADNHLYLIGLLDADECPVDPAIVFDHRQLPIAADWFSGRLEVGQGEALTYFHMGWGHEYSTLLRLYLRQGRVVARRRYDQTRRLRRHFERFVAANPNWLEILKEEAEVTHSGRGPLGSLTAAGVKALGRPELAGEGVMETWPAGLTDDEWAEVASRLLQHCVRAPGGAALNVLSTPRVPGEGAADS
jgi:hypothetical protein